MKILLLLAAQWALAAAWAVDDDIPAATTAAPQPTPCSGHGVLKCDCHRGYEGVNCDAEIDWCSRLQEDFQGEHNMSAACGPHGVCYSDHEKGASCACLAGFTGPFCQDLPTDAKVARRCVQPEIDIEEGSGVVHCEDDERCLLDDLDCAHSRNKEVVEQCRSQKGYCLPDAKVAAVLEQKRREEEARKRCEAAAEEGRFKSAEPVATKCEHGDSICTCDPGYEGDNCEQEVDYCAAGCLGIGEEDFGAVCGKHGRCESSPNGIVCVCDHGFIGQFCEQADQSVVIQTHRCVQKKIPVRENQTYHCPEGKRCVIDDFDCYTDGAAENNEQCVEPLGWCLPYPFKPRPITTTINPDVDVSGQPGFNVTSSPIDLNNNSTTVHPAEISTNAFIEENDNNKTTTTGPGMIDEKICDQRIAEAVNDVRENFPHSTFG